MQAEKVLLVTVNVHETQAVLTAIKAITGSAPRTHPIEQRTYRNLGKIGSASVWHALSEMGTATVGGTLQTVDLAIRALNPTMVIAVGIAFGVNEEKQKIGDVLVSRHLMLYEPARISAGEVLPRGDKPHASARLINLFEGVAQTLSQEYPVRVGAILSGEKLIDNIDYRNSLVSLANEAIGGEMEGGGVYASCVEHKVDWIVIKSICDWADGNKGVDKEARQIEAANSSASFIAQALKEVFGGAHSPTPSETIITAATPSVDSLTAARVERVTPLLEVLATRFQQYRMMADHYFRYILNKVPKVEASFEGSRAAKRGTRPFHPGLPAPPGR